MQRRTFVFGLGALASGRPDFLVHKVQLGKSVYDDEDKDFGVPAASTIRRPPYEAPTPLRVSGVTTVTTRELKAMLDSGGPPVVFDVRGIPGPCRGRPEEDCGSQTLSVPTALWLPGAGMGTSLTDDVQRKFAGRLKKYACGDRANPVVFFCYSKNSWLSVNAALRAVALGYRRVYWYRGGRVAWRAAGLPATPVYFVGTLQAVPLAQSTFCDEGHDYGIAPTAGTIRTSRYEAPTPTSVVGTTTISTPKLWEMLLSDEPPVLIDVLGGNQRMTLPGALWSPGAGRGLSLNDSVQQQLAAELARATCGDKNTPVVLFCQSKTCWLSVNTAVRAVALDYANVYWYRGGRCGWQAGGLPMGPVNLLSRGVGSCCDGNNRNTPVAPYGGSPAR